ncbi:RCC1 domain-containing protein [Hyalangium versicolor]|uniref:RCC1 domain-containing protein n=1 Tax=Hyalangium versicolor TaxID=2861190 RepID=UPI001CCAF0E3|nr:RCC1 domain-containing protein [Hyalangium versicolor]
MQRACVSWLLGALIMLVASPAAADDVAWGKPVKGVQLGLAIVPNSGPLPTELELEAVARNVTSEPQQIPVQVCSTVHWTAFTQLHVRTASGRVFSYPIDELGDVADLHPHGPVNLAPGEMLRERFSLKRVVGRPTENPKDAELWNLLETPQQVELWMELVGGAGVPRRLSGHLKHRLGLPPTKAPVQAGRCVSQIAAGGSSACALLRDGTPWCWGSHPPGARGTEGDTQDKRELSPQPLRLLAGNAVELSVALDIACVRTFTGAGYCAGGNLDFSEAAYGEPGGHPVRIQRLEGAAELYGAQCARVTDGSLACWSLLGPLTSSTDGLFATRWEESTPGVAQVATGGGFTCALRRDGTLWCWGANESGQLGAGDVTPHPGPTRVSKLPLEVVSVAAGTSHACAALRDGSLWCWGRSEYGALGQGDVRSSSVPIPISGMSEVVRVAAGVDKTCAWKKDGSLWCFGELLEEEPFPALARVPVEMKELGHHVEEVVFGFRHTCARISGEGGEGNVLCWGENTEGQSGSAKPSALSSPLRVSGLKGQAVALAAGDRFTCAITTDGSAWCWGIGTEGQLGTGRKDSSARPMRVRLPCSG